MSLKNINHKKNSLTHFRHLFWNKKSEGSQQETPLCTFVHASFTVEAAVTIPIFVCFMVAILFFFCILQLQMKVESAMHYTAETLASYACLEEKHDELMNAQTELAAAEILFRTQLAEQDTRLEYISGNSLGISLLTSELSGDYVELKAVYRIQLPVSLFGSRYFPMHQTVKVRKWTGAAADEEESEWVYVTPSGTVYHRSKSCPYLDLSIHSVSRSEVKELRNKSGAKYQECSQCKGGGAGMVYITDYGTAYHSELYCSALKRTVYRIQISEAGGRKACSKCGGGT